MIFVNICFNVDGYLFIYCIMDFDMDFLVWSMVDYMEMICKRVEDLVWEKFVDVLENLEDMVLKDFFLKLCRLSVDNNEMLVVLSEL